MNPMKPHLLVQQAIESRNFTLLESWVFVWTGGLTARVRYLVIDENDNLVAKEEFAYNRHPATYVPQGLRARVGSARYSALDRLAQKIVLLPANSSSPV